MEHFGDDFLAALADSTEVAEEWDEVSGNDLKTNADDVCVIDDDEDDGFPVRIPKESRFVDLDSSSDSEISFGARKRKLSESTPGSLVRIDSALCCFFNCGRNF